MGERGGIMDKEVGGGEIKGWLGDGYRFGLCAVIGRSILWHSSCIDCIHTIADKDMYTNSLTRSQMTGLG